MRLLSRAADQDVLRLQVAVDHPLRVGVRDAEHDLEEHPPDHVLLERVELLHLCFLTFYLLVTVG